MSNKKEKVSLPKDEIRRLLRLCMRRKGITTKELADKLNYASANIVYNALSSTNSQMTMDTLSKLCAALEYPLDDILAGREYVDPQSLEWLARKLDKAIERITNLENEVKRLKETNEQVTT